MYKPELTAVKKTCADFLKYIEKDLKNKDGQSALNRYKDFVGYWEKTRKDMQQKDPNDIMLQFTDTSLKHLFSTDNFLRALFNKYKIKIK